MISRRVMPRHSLQPLHIVLMQQAERGHSQRFCGPRRRAGLGHLLTFLRLRPLERLNGLERERRLPGEPDDMVGPSTEAVE